MNDSERTVLKKFIVGGTASRGLADVKFASGHTVTMVYPTNDLWLTKRQFEMLKRFLKLIGEKEFLLADFDGGKSLEGLFSEHSDVRKLSVCSRYSSYHNINLSSVSVMFSSSGAWALLLDETLDGGWGVFLSDEKHTEIFNKCYEPVKEDYKRIMDKERYERDLKYYASLIDVDNIE